MRFNPISKILGIAFAVSIFTSLSIGQTTFPGTGVGAIPDATACAPSPGTPLVVSFAVSGIASAPSNVRVSLTMDHTWTGDVIAVLRAPNGTAHTIFGRMNATTATAAGESSNLGGTYTFENAATLGFWAAGTAAPGSNDIIAAGNYRTSATGGVGQTGAATDMNAAFSAIPTSNGTWTITFTDGCDADTGNVTAASLILTGAVPIDAPNDLNGDGRTDFMVVRANAALALGGGANDQIGKDVVGAKAGQALVSPQATINWYNRDNASGNFSAFSWGSDTDFFQVQDYNGDGRDDITVWRPGAQGVFYTLLSGTNTVRTDNFGQTGDDATIASDFDGDGTADYAVYRDGTAGSPQSFFYYRGSLNNPGNVITYIPWGTDGDVAYALDYDGDGKADPAVQRNGGGGVGDHYIRRSSNGATYYVRYGLSSDFVVPGDYDGDGRDDIVVSRNANFGNGTFKYFWILESDGGGLPQSPVQWGISGDFICQGDYDGDGKTDIAVWRSNADPTQNYFYVRRSSDGGFLPVEWGASGDYPVNNWDVH